MRWRHLLHPTRFFSPRGLIVRAAVLTAVFGLLHLLGLREYACVFSGTSPTGGHLPHTLAAMLGATYVVLYLLVVVVVPVFVIAAGFLCLYSLVTRCCRDSPDRR